MLRKIKSIFSIFIFFVVIFVLSTYVKSDSPSSDIIEKISSKFLGTPYHFDPLGEGNDISEGQGTQNKDADPLYRTDVFDCLTYVETVLANAINFTEQDSKDIVDTMSQIRYFDGNISFINRTHFQYPDWVNNNSKILEIATDDIASATNIKTDVSTINLCRGNWFKKVHNITIVDDSCMQVSLTYLPLSEILNHITELEHTITTPHIFMTVISDPILPQTVGTEYNISHTGFIIPYPNGKLYLRHASRIRGKVTDSNFVSYIKSLQKHKKFLGFAILKINL